ncbi:hypothetical protein ml_326 [Mollivirus sibericum]|uniref:hypothetical protein n=1 Tax=Mollivirus sibericum TaxID=1678078 RepID=UPI0006B2EC40|nr:hypothetical protein ml_326 [Mollivirus sibericum]ALD62128.1 hypothetical protein ml_326 [Mollivirus sibericum]
MFVVVVSKDRPWERNRHYLAWTAADACEIIEDELGYNRNECFLHVINPKGHGKLSDCQAFINFDRYLSDRRHRCADRYPDTLFEEDPEVATWFKRLCENLDGLETEEPPEADTTPVICEYCNSYEWRPSVYSNYDPQEKPHKVRNPAPVCSECGKKATTTMSWGLQ